MSSEATSALTFSDLILAVAFKLGMAYYGVTGDTAPQIPVDAHDLAVCKGVVNDAIRMFINDAPQPNGWRWTKPIAQVDFWPTISDSASNPIVTAVFDAPSGLTTITATADSFYQSMELQTIHFNNSATSATIVSYISARVVTVKGDHHLIAGQTWSMVANGDYTLSANFGGEYSGEITFIASTNRGMILHWVDEATLRQRRQNYNIETGTPYMAAVRLMPTPQLPTDYTAPRRRWELMVWRQPSEFLSVIFPYVLAFDSLVNLTDVPPAPIGHDEAIRAACLAVAERDVEELVGGPRQAYYMQALQNSYRVDNMSAPKDLGYFGNPTAASQKRSAIEVFRSQWYQRPIVPVN